MRANIHLRKARQAEYMDDLESALEHYEQAFAKADNEEVRQEALRNLGITQAKTGRLKASVESFETYIADFPKDDQGYVNLKASYNANGQTEKVVPMLRKGINKATPPGLLYIVLATQLIQEGKREKAIEHLESVQGKLHDIILSDFTINLMHQLFDAIEATQYQKQPTLETVRREASALKHVAAVGALWADKDTHFLVRYGGLAHDSGDVDEAVSIFLKAGTTKAEINELQVGMHLASCIGLATCYIEQGKTGMAVQLMETYASHPMFESATEVNYPLALAYFVDGVDDKALEYCKRITPEQPTQFNKTTNIADMVSISNAFAMSSAIYARQGNPDAASVLMEAAIRSLPAPAEDTQEILDTFNQYVEQQGLNSTFFSVPTEKVRSMYVDRKTMVELVLEKNGLDF